MLLLCLYLWMRIHIAFPIIVAILTVGALHEWRDPDGFLPIDFRVPFGHVYRHTQCIQFSSPPKFEANFGGILLMLHPQTIIFKHSGTYIILDKTIFPVALFTLLVVVVGLCVKIKRICSRVSS